MNPIKTTRHVDSARSPGVRLVAWGAACIAVSCATGLVAWKAPVPRPLAGPTSPVVMQEMVIVQGAEGDRVVARGDADLKSPTYNLTVGHLRTNRVERELAVDPGGSGLDWSPRPMLSLGLYHRTSVSRFDLRGLRIDGTPGSYERSGLAPEGAGDIWRPKVVAFLNARHAGSGDELDRFFTTEHKQDSWVCWQNGCVLIAWLCGLAGVLMLGAGAARWLVRERALGSPMA